MTQNQHASYALSLSDEEAKVLARRVMLSRDEMRALLGGVDEYGNVGGFCISKLGIVAALCPINRGGPYEDISPFELVYCLGTFPPSEPISPIQFLEFSENNGLSIAASFAKEVRTLVASGWYDEQNEMTPEERQDAEAWAHIGFYEREHVETWLGIGAVAPQEAALLFYGRNPLEYKDQFPFMGKEFDLMLRTFEDLARDGLTRNLRDWLTEARTRNLHGVAIEGWEACANVLKRDAGTFAPVVEEIDYSVLASRDQLIAAFGVFTGMQLKWFDKLETTHALYSARKVAGQGGRGHIIEPRFCPYEVLLWLIDEKRRKGKPLGTETGWRLLKAHFPKVHSAHSEYDPNGD